jgi:hypothetical protein
VRTRDHRRGTTRTVTRTTRTRDHRTANRRGHRWNRGNRGHVRTPARPTYRPARSHHVITRRARRWRTPRYYPVSAPPVATCESTLDSTGFYFWVCGYYAWDTYSGYYWVDGHWELVSNGREYRPAHWYNRNGRFHFQAGGWIN